jgi:hypothetical protein
MVMGPFLAQNKHRSNVHKENNTKIENKEEYKIFTRCAKLSLKKKLVHGPTHASHNSCLAVNINIYKKKITPKFKI